MARTTRQSNTAYALREDAYYGRAESGFRGTGGARSARARGIGEAEARRNPSSLRESATAQSAAIPRTAAAVAAAPVRFSHITPLSIGRKIRMISTIVLMGALFFCVIFLMAYGASIQRDLNHANSEMVSVKDDIDNLTLAIERGQNVGAIERKAADELGMIHPGETQLKYLAELELEPTDMAQAIREKAYGA